MKIPPQLNGFAFALACVALVAAREGVGPVNLVGVAADNTADVTSGHAVKVDASATTQPVTVSAGTALMGQVSSSQEVGTVYGGTTPLTVTRKGGTDSSSGATTIVSAVSGKSIYVLYFALTANGTVNANLQSHTTTSNTSLTMYEVANTGISTGWVPPGMFATTSGEALDLDLSASVAVGYTVVYVSY